jgi:hypothetical protein
MGAKNRNWILHNIAKGRLVSVMLVFTAVCTLEFKFFGLKFNRNYVLVVAGLQLLFYHTLPCLHAAEK